MNRSIKNISKASHAKRETILSGDHWHVLHDGQRLSDQDIGFCPSRHGMAVQGQSHIEYPEQPRA